MEPRNKEIIPDNPNSVNENEIMDKAAADKTPAAFSDEGMLKPTRLPFFDRVRKSGFFTKGFCAIVLAFLISAVIYAVSRFVPSFAEFWTRYPAQGIRFILAKITGWIPFSLAEGLLVSLPFLTVAYMIASTVSTKRDESNVNFYRWFRPLVSIILVIITLFFSAFGPAYGRYTLAQNIGIQQNPVTAEQLFQTGKTVAKLAEENLDAITFDISGSSVMPYGFDELVDKVNQAFDEYAEDKDYISHFDSEPKAIALSDLMTYTHISGVYTFMTGESNINTNYPDFLMPFTVAHEMAHQRGIAREDEANFVAFLVCIGSDDPYLRYSGYANMLNYLLSAIGDADIRLYSEFAIDILPDEISAEFVEYSRFFDEYRDSVASEVTGTVNNTFLQSQGQEAGTKSYGLVVDLAVAYYN